MQFKDDIVEWIITSLSVPSSTFNNFPACPYAKKAYTDNKIIYHEMHLYEHISIKDNIKSELENYTYHWPKNIEVVVIGTDPQAISSDELSEVVTLANHTFLKDRGYIALEDHPDEIEQVDGINLNQGKYALVLLQEESKLHEARKFLQEKNYYKNWDPQYLEEVINR